MSNWGILVRGFRFDSESKCWRCLDETVPAEDELGLCDMCIASLQAQPVQPLTRDTVNSPPRSARRPENLS